MLSQFLQRLGRRPSAAALGGFFGNKLHRAVHADGKDLLDLGQVGVDATMLDERPVASDARLDRLAILGVRADLARQGQQRQRLFQVHILGPPAFRKRGAGRFLVLFRRLAALHVWPEPARAQGDHILTILAQHLVTGQVFRIAADGPGVTTFRVVAAAHEAAGFRGLEMQLAGAAKRADARVRAVLARGVELRRERCVQLVQDFGDPQLGCL